MRDRQNELKRGGAPRLRVLTMGGSSDGTLGSDPEHPRSTEPMDRLADITSCGPVYHRAFPVPTNAEMFLWNAINLKSRTKRVSTRRGVGNRSAFHHRHQLCSRHGVGVVLRAECFKMTLSIGDYTTSVSSRVTALSVGSADTPLTRTRRRSNGPPARQVEGWIAGLKKRIPLLRRSIAECDRMASDLDQEVRNEEDRVKVHDPANIAYSIYAKATASRRDNVRCSADELRSHLSKVEQQLRTLGEASPL
jgi:hypothetical protein